ncbi:MAG: polyphosphate kinase 2 [Hyphomicrobiales bacterium]
MTKSNSSSSDQLLEKYDLDSPKLASRIKDAAMQSGHYPYEDKLSRKTYEHDLRLLQIELVKVQAWAQNTGARLLLVFEGRDAAGKGGTINAIRAYMNPRSARIAALPKPTEREMGQWYFQRYIQHLPTTGETVLFDRSWYNRAGVEPVMGFCTPEQHATFLQEAPKFEQMLVDEGIHLFKFWLNIGREMQMKRFHDRRHDPLKQWKLSPMDVASLDKWDDYTAKRNLMLKKTHTVSTPWTIVRSNDKRRARLNAIRHVLTNLDYDRKDKDAIGKIDPLVLGQGPEFLRLHESMDFTD